jgi:hypothetical protein
MLYPALQWNCSGELPEPALKSHWHHENGMVRLPGRSSPGEIPFRHVCLPLPMSDALTSIVPSTAWSKWDAVEYMRIGEPF